MKPVDPTVRCDVYRNLNKPPVTYSIRQQGKVVAYSGAVVLRDCAFKHANPDQREACKSRRLVCQWVKGFVTNSLPDGEWVRLSCDPKKSEGFCRADTNQRIESAAFVSLSQAGCFAIL